MHLAAVRATIPMLMKNDSSSAAICKCTLGFVVFMSPCRIQRSLSLQTWDLDLTSCHGVALVIITGLTGNYCGYPLYNICKGFRSLLIEVRLLWQVSIKWAFTCSSESLPPQAPCSQECIAHFKYLSIIVRDYRTLFCFKDC